jgi:hypothetical protein
MVLLISARPVLLRKPADETRMSARFHFALVCPASLPTFGLVCLMPTHRLTGCHGSGILSLERRARQKLQKTS